MSSPLALTCGDPAGVGPEIIEQWLRETKPPRESVCVIGPRLWLAGLERWCVGIAVGSENYVATPGQPDEMGAQVALAALEEAAAGCREGRYRAVVTAPVSKAQLAKVGYAFPGQTEFFAARWEGEATMAFAGGRMRVVLATWHIPLMRVAKALDRSTLSLAVERAHLLAQRLGTDAPRIAVCGLNPHAGEGGLLGEEELHSLDPWLEELRSRFPGVSKCQPADTVFRAHLNGEYDVVVALYHDQGLAPLKTLEFDQAVNITLGLRWVRTSPDHGTGFPIAGQGKADAGSFTNACALAMRLSA